MFPTWDNGQGPGRSADNAKAWRTGVLFLFIRHKVGLLAEPDPTLLAYPPSGPTLPLRSAPGRATSTTRCHHA